MVALARFDAEGQWQDTWVCDDLVRQNLAPAGVRIGRWPVRQGAGQGLAAVRAAYGGELAALKQNGGAEIHLFRSGTGLFYLRSGEGFFGLLCEAGEWVALPAGLAHSFDAGDAPAFEVLRLFGQFRDVAEAATGAAVPALLPHDAFVAGLLERMGEELSE
ncbi:MAG: hypothetical protein WBC18_27500 [Ottowia sp.]|uniref:hypothetical protein n=1 Tax=Ottowia sp. TaxID=1898956 RepID=UPI003C72DAFF